MVNQTPMKDMVRFVTVTTDPANDTAAVMSDYGPAHGLDPANWSFLTTTPDQPEDETRRLALSYGHKFDKTGNGYQVHGVVTHVIDRDGRWRGNFHGLRFNSTNLVMFINALTDGSSAPHGNGKKIGETP
jgi:protein SCO1